MGVVLYVRTFEADCTDKAQAVKVLEEAAEAFAAWQRVIFSLDHFFVDVTGKSADDYARMQLADELADVVQASCNLAARYGIDMAEAMDRCTQRMRERGNYD